MVKIDPPPATGINYPPDRSAMSTTPRVGQRSTTPRVGQRCVGNRQPPGGEQDSAVEGVGVDERGKINDWYRMRSEVGSSDEIESVLLPQLGIAHVL